MEITSLTWRIPFGHLACSFANSLMSLRQIPHSIEQPLARAWLGLQARPRCVVCTSGSLFKNAAEMTKGRAPAAFGFGFAYAGKTQERPHVSALPQGRALRSAATRLQIHSSVPPLRTGRERKSPNPPGQTTAWGRVRFAHLAPKTADGCPSGTRGRGASQSEHPRPRFGHLLKTPRLLLAARSKLQTLLPRAPEGENIRPPSKRCFRKHRGDPRTRQLQAASVKGNIRNFPISGLVESILRGWGDAPMLPTTRAYGKLY